MKNNFKEDGYLLVRDLIEPGDMYDYLQTMVDEGKGRMDTVAGGKYAFYGDSRFEELLESTLPAIERLTGYRLFKTYSYARLYNMGNVLEAHRDRAACEVTVSICLGNDAQTWPLWLRDKEGIDRSFALEPGDAFLFKGIELTHWREENTFGRCGQVFLHYVDQDGPYTAERDDPQTKALIKKLALAQAQA